MGIVRSPFRAIDPPAPSLFNELRFDYNWGMFRFLRPVYDARIASRLGLGDNFTEVVGNHSLRFGVDLERDSLLI
jgi:hypothetical protein